MPVIRLPLAASEPLYVRLKIALRDLIRNRLQPGDRLPSEIELCERYDISRITVRQALGALESEGAIERRQGRGSFVCQPKLQEPVAYFGSFSEEVAAQGKRGSSRLVSVETMEADSRVSVQLRIDPGTKVMKIRRVRCVGKTPICYQVSYVSHALVPNITRADLRRGSLYKYLERALNEAIHEADETIEAISADPYRADLLEVAEGAALLLINRTVFTRSGRAVEFNRSFYNAALISLTLRSRRAAFGMQSRLAFRTPDYKVVAND